MKMLSLTIVIPVYNEERHLRACLQAIAEQTIMPQEVIVVDNNSSDRSVEVAEHFSFVRVVGAPKQGIAYARDTGFDAAQSDLIGRIDADTILPETWVENALQFFAHKQNFVLTGGGYFYNVPLPRLNGWITSQITYRMNRFIMGHYILWGSNMVLPNKLWQQVRNEVCSDNPHIHEDLDLAIHLHRKQVPITYSENLRVGVEMKRVYNTESSVHKARMLMWPQTLYAHNLKRAWLGRIGAFFLYQGRFFVRLSAATAKMIRISRAHLESEWKSSF